MYGAMFRTNIYFYAIRDTQDARRVFMQNKANFSNNQMNISPFMEKYYDNYYHLKCRKNKPNSNPSKPNPTPVFGPKIGLAAFYFGKAYGKTTWFEVIMSDY